MSLFVVIRERSEAWEASRGMREQEGWQEHAAFMEALAESGFLRLAGPLGDGARVLLVVEARDTQEIRARLDGDPWTPRLLRIERIDPWQILVGSPPGKTTAA